MPGDILRDDLPGILPGGNGIPAERARRAGGTERGARAHPSRYGEARATQSPGDALRVVVAAHRPGGFLGERLARSGTESLSDVDLLALVLACGQPGPVGAALARRLNLRYPSLADLAVASPAELATVEGMSAARAAALSAAIALGRRVDHRELAAGDPVTASESVFRHFHPRLVGLKQERFYVVMLDGKGRLMREVRVSEGSLTASLVHPREVFRAAIREAAASLILVHNHPSGDPEPSAEDLKLTARLRAAGELLGIRVLDHVVIGHGRWASLAELGKL